MRYLVDTSVWIDHLRKSIPELKLLLDSGDVLTHSHMIGELATGNFKDRSGFLGNLKLLARVNEATHEEILDLIEKKWLFGRGLSLGDVHLLASARIEAVCIVSHDLAVLKACRDLKIPSKSFC